MTTPDIKPGTSTPPAEKKVDESANPSERVRSVDETVKDMLKNIPKHGT